MRENNVVKQRALLVQFVHLNSKNTEFRICSYESPWNFSASREQISNAIAHAKKSDSLFVLDYNISSPWGGDIIKSEKYSVSNNIAIVRAIVWTVNPESSMAQLMSGNSQPNNSYFVADLESKMILAVADTSSAAIAKFGVLIAELKDQLKLNPTS